MLSIRKIGAFGKTYRHLNRYRQILGVLFKHGFGDLIERLHIDQYIEIGLQFLSSSRSPASPRSTREVRIRSALEELGPAYIKLGQLLSTRSDFIPMRFIDELVKLQENAPRFPFHDVQKVIRREFGVPVNVLFDTFDPVPIASASIGQVHRARTRNGDDVAVKVQRPGIRRIIEVDLEIMLHLAMLMEGNIEEVALHRPVKIVEEFARMIEKELDYANEAANMERFARQFFDEPGLYVPVVHGELSGKRVLTMDYIKGVKISMPEALKEAGLNRKKIVRRGAEFFFRQIFDYGFFHADPHPGNIRILSGNVICFLDFGMMGTVDRFTRGDFADLIYAVVRQDEARTTQMLLKLTSWENEPDLRLLESDVSDIIGQYLHKPLKDIEIGKLLRQILELTSRHHLRIPTGIFMMMKALSTIEGIAYRLFPEYDIVSHMAPFIRREKMNRFRPGRIAEDLFNISSDFLQFVQQFPREALEIVRLIKKQRFTIQFEHRGLDDMIDTHERISSKLAFAVIIGSLIIGSSIIIIAKIPPMFYGISLIGIIVFTVAALLGLWLIYAIIRHGRF